MIRDFILWDIGSLWIPTQYGVLDLGSERISGFIAKEDLWSQWICRQTVRVGSMIRTDPGSSSFGSAPGIHFRDPWTCLGTIWGQRRVSRPISPFLPVAVETFKYTETRFTNEEVIMFVSQPHLLYQTYGAWSTQRPAMAQKRTALSHINALMSPQL